MFLLSLTATCQLCAVSLKAGLNTYKGCAADCQKPTLRCGLWQRLTPSVRLQVETQSIPGYPPRQEENTMTILLKQAFEKASQLPDDLQDQLAQEVLEDIAGELQWDTTLAQSEALLEKLAEQALREFEAGRTRPQGFDEL
jgi:hypothetical protein